MRVLALDYGKARCGCALSDPTGTLATPIDQVERPDSPGGIDALAALATEAGVGLIVIGLPLTLRGEEGDQARATRAFAGRLAKRISVPIKFHDERFTTGMAAASARQAGGAAQSEDSRAAAHLLTGYLEQKHAGEAGSGSK